MLLNEQLNSSVLPYLVESLKSASPLVDVIRSSDAHVTTGSPRANLDLYWRSTGNIRIFKECNS